MTTRSFRRARGPRRAAAIDPTRALAPNNGGDSDTAGTILRQGLAALAVSTLGLGLAATVALTAAAQSLETAQSAITGRGTPDSTQAQAAPPVDQQAQGAAVDPERETDQQPAADGDLEAFNRSTADGTSRSAVRAEIDRAVADQKARERGANLTAIEEEQTKSSGRAIQDARSTNLVNTAEATKREQARLAQEKRKAEEALKAQQEAARVAAEQTAQQGNLPSQPAASQDASAAKNSSGNANTSVGAPAAAAPRAAAAPAVGPIGGGAVKPMASYVRGSGWGAVGSWSRYHTGIDLSAPIGTQIRAVDGGVVVSPNAGGWAGNHVIIRHTDGTYTLYAHMSHSAVRPGQQVSAGQAVGAVGLTGRTFGPHLHFEHYPAGGSTSNPYSSDDPYRWMLSKGVRL